MPVSTHISLVRYDAGSGIYGKYCISNSNRYFLQFAIAEYARQIVLCRLSFELLTFPYLLPKMSQIANKLCKISDITYLGASNRQIGCNGQVLYLFSFSIKIK